MENDTIKKIDDAIDAIKKQENAKKEEKNEFIKEDTDTKLFSIEKNDSNERLEKTKEFNGIIEEKVEVNNSDDEDISLYVLYFTSLIIVVVLVITFILFFYK